MDRSPVRAGSTRRARQRALPQVGRGGLLLAVFVVLIALLGAAVVRWRPSEATNSPFATVQARWTVANLTGEEAFVGLGIFVYRPNWDGPAQVFPGPVLLQVQDAQAPVRMRFEGDVAVHRASDGGAPEVTTDGSGAASATPVAAGGQDVTLETGDLVAVPARTRFSVTTGEGETVRFLAVAVLPEGPPATPGVQQVEWRAWGNVAPVLGMPLVVTIEDVELAGGEAYQFQRARGPALLSVEGSGDGTQSIALTVTKGLGTYLRMAEFPAWDLTATAAYEAVQTPTILNRERAFDARSGAFLPAGTTARLHNRSLVDGTGVVLVTFDGPTVVTPVPSPTFRPTVRATATATGTRPAG
jgi:hypothetical protein